MLACPLVQCSPLDIVPDFAFAGALALLRVVVTSLPFWMRHVFRGCLLTRHVSHSILGAGAAVLLFLTSDVSAATSPTASAAAASAFAIADPSTRLVRQGLIPTGDFGAAIAKATGAQIEGTPSAAEKSPTSKADVGTPESGELHQSVQTAPSRTESHEQSSSSEGQANPHSCADPGLRAQGCRCFSAATGTDPCNGIFPCIDCGKSAYVNRAGESVLLHVGHDDESGGGDRPTRPPRSREKYVVLPSGRVHHRRGDKQHSVDGVGGNGTTASGGDVDRMGGTDDSVQQAKRRTDSITSASRRSSMIELEATEAAAEFSAELAGADAHVIDAAGLMDAELASHQSRGGLSMVTRIFGFRETCASLSLVGYVSTESCRDSWGPHFSPNCRCERLGQAWPSKFCSVQGVSGNTAKSRPSENVQGVTARTDQDEVFGRCDMCCFRTGVLVRSTMFTPILILLCLCGCLGTCGLMMKRLQESSERIKEMEAKMAAAAAAAEQQQQVMLAQQEAMAASAAAGSSGSGEAAIAT